MDETTRISNDGVFEVMIGRTRVLGLALFILLATASALPSVSASGSATAPARPGGVGVEAGAEAGVALVNWNGADGQAYRIYRGTSASKVSLVAEVGSASTFEDLSATAGATLHYRVSAVTDGAESALSEAASVVTRDVPGAPQALVAVRGDAAGSIRLQWQPPASNGGASVEAYVVFRARSCSGPLGQVAVVGNVTTYVDTGLESGASYHYEVRARTAIGTGPSSACASATTPAPPAPPRNTSGQRTGILGEVRIEWEPPGVDGGLSVTAYSILRAEARNGPYAEVAVVSNVEARVFVDSGLGPGISYHYRVVAHNEAGASVETAPVTVVAPGTPGPPSNVTVEKSGVASLRVQWGPPSDDGGLGVQGYVVMRANASTGPFHVVAQTSATSFVDTGLAAGRTFHYRVHAKNEAGIGVESSVAAESTFGVPSAPAVQVEQGQSAGELRVSWQPPADNGGLSVSAFVVFRAEARSGPFVEVATVTDASVFVDSDLSPGTTFYYQVRAQNAAGIGLESSVDAEATFDTPTAPRQMAATRVYAAGEINVTWHVPEHDGGLEVSRYVVSRANASAGPFVEVAVVADVTWYLDVGLQAGARFWYRVVAENAAGPGLVSATVHATTHDVAHAPGSILVSSGSAKGEVRVQWSSAFESGDLLVDDYVVLRANASSGPFVAVAVGVEGFLFVDVGLEAEREYHYQVRARNAAGTGPSTPPASALPPDVPGVPSLVYAVRAQLRGHINVYWIAPSDDGGLSVTAYEVAVADTATGAFVSLATTSESVTSFQHGGLLDGQSRYYRVRAANAQGWGPWSPSAVGTAPVHSGPPVTVQAVRASVASVQIEWSHVEDTGGLSVEGHVVEYGDSASRLDQRIVVPWGQSWTDDDIEPGQTRHYQVRAVTAVGEGSPTNVVTFALPDVPAAPRNFQADDEMGIARVWLTWDAVADDGGSPLLGYHVYRRSSSAHDWALVASTQELWHSDGPVVPGARYEYYVAAVNDVGDSVFNEQASSLGSLVWGHHDADDDFVPDAAEAVVCQATVHDAVVSVVPDVGEVCAGADDVALAPWREDVLGDGDEDWVPDDAEQPVCASTSPVLTTGVGPSCKDDDWQWS